MQEIACVVTCNFEQWLFSGSKMLCRPLLRDSLLFILGSLITSTNLNIGLLELEIRDDEFLNVNVSVFFVRSSMYSAIHS